MKYLFGKFSRVFAVFLFATALVSCQLPVFAAKDDALFDDPVIAKGKGFEIKRSQLEEAFIAYKANAAAVNERIPESKREELEAELLNELILTKILLEKATPADKTKAKGTADALVKQVKSRASSEEIFKMRLKALGLSVEDFEKQVSEQELRKEVLRREVASKVAIPEEKIKKYYEDNLTEFERPERVKAAHILLATSEKGVPVSPERKKEKEVLIKKLRERAVNGEDFGQLAREFSDDPGSRSKGGEYTFGRNEMVPAFEKAAFSLREGQVSEVVETQFGFHIIKLLQKIPAKTESLSEAAPRIKDYLVGQELNTELPPYYEKLKQEAGVEILDEKLKTAMAEAKSNFGGTLKK